jgi:hypothetical protein
MLKLVTVAIDAGTIGLVGECLSGDIDMDLSNSIARRVEVYGITRKDGIDFHIDGCKRASCVRSSVNRTPYSRISAVLICRLMLLGARAPFFASWVASIETPARNPMTYFMARSIRDPPLSVTPSHAERSVNFQFPG